MIKREKLYDTLFLLLIVALLSFLQILLYLKGFYALSADEAGHTLEAYYWFKDSSNFYSIWLPFQKILYGFAFHISDDLIWMPRILSSIFGALTLMALIFLTNELFQNKIISLFTGLLGACFWGIVVFSVLPMTEIYFSFFTITSIAFLIRWKRKKSNASLWLALLFMSIGSTIRYETWVFTFIIFVIVFIEIIKTNEILLNKLIKLLLVIIILISFPIIWASLSFKVTGEFTGFMRSVAERYRPGETISEIQNNVIYNFFSINFITANIIGLFTFALLKKKSEIRLYFFIFISTLIIIGVVAFITKSMPTHNSWRLATIWSILLLPLTAYFCYYLYSIKYLFIRYSLVLFLLILVSLFIRQINRYTQVSYMNKRDFVVGNYINDNLLIKGSSPRIFIQRNNWEYSNILISSQHPTAFVTENDFINDSSFTSIPYFEGVKKKLKDFNVRYVILKPYNEDFFDLNNLTLIISFDSWMIYRLE